MKRFTVDCAKCGFQIYRDCVKEIPIGRYTNYEHGRIEEITDTTCPDCGAYVRIVDVWRLTETYNIDTEGEP